jgi:hypothetical protein
MRKEAKRTQQRKKNYQKREGKTVTAPAIFRMTGSTEPVVGYVTHRVLYTCAA